MTARRSEVNRLMIFMASCNLIRSLKQFINLLQVASSCQTERPQIDRQAVRRTRFTKQISCNHKSRIANRKTRIANRKLRVKHLPGSIIKQVVLGKCQQLTQMNTVNE